MIPSTSTTSLPGYTMPVLSKGCKPGYLGNKCESPCRYPSYGIDCQLECKCSGPEKCDHVKGCVELNPFCSTTKHAGNEEAMLYSTIVLSILAVLQFIAYIYLSFCYNP
ncbi:tyrosine-protein kinase receptor Tie-1-like [Saccostrea cucullata]|uniref:tyrosine-protein kinase receptor Tie-1-like n=1 Tax=Saccostrea cuccullata TaxID=36930 RepID=UPI002ECFD605